MEELKPCPFCGGKAIINEYLNSLFWTRCVDCGAEIQALSTVDDAKSEWNRRADECDTNELLRLSEELEYEKDTRWIAERIDKALGVES